MPLTAEEIAKLRSGLETWDHGLSVEAMNDIEAALDEVERTRALLRRIEWNGAPDEVFGETCPCCCNDKQDGHEPGCELAALLGGEPTSWRSRLQAIITELDREHTPEALALANRLNDALLGGEG
jgi:hypothetical protein